MKHQLIVLIIAASATSVYAQFSLPPRNPYVGSLPSIINVGGQSQIKIGVAATLGVTLGAIADNVLLASMLEQGRPGYISDSQIVMRRELTGNSEWSPSELFALDTNAPISVNGTWSSNSVLVNDLISAPVLSYSSVVSGGPERQVLMCSDNNSGALEKCTQQGGVQVTLTAEPNIVSSSNPRAVTLHWSATNALECHGVSGNGFYTAGQLVGSDKTNVIKGIKGDVESFTIACTDALGTVVFESVDISVQ